MSAVDDARRMFDQWLVATNERDVERGASFLHTPHIILPSTVLGGDATDVRVWKDAAEARDAVAAGYESLRSEGCHLSVAESVEAVQSSDEKVHFAVTFAREHEDGTVYMRLNVMWVATWEDGRWGCKLRSAMPPVLMAS